MWWTNTRMTLRRSLWNGGAGQGRECVQGTQPLDGWMSVDLLLRPATVHLPSASLSGLTFLLRRNDWLVNGVLNLESHSLQLLTGSPAGGVGTSRCRDQDSLLPLDLLSSCVPPGQVQRRTRPIECEGPPRAALGICMGNRKVFHPPKI